MVKKETHIHDSETGKIHGPYSKEYAKILLKQPEGRYSIAEKIEDPDEPVLDLTGDDPVVEGEQESAEEE